MASQWPITPALAYFYSPLDGMLIHRRITPNTKFAGTHKYTWVEGGKVFPEGHNTMLPTRAQILTA